MHLIYCTSTNTLLAISNFTALGTHVSRLSGDFFRSKLSTSRSKSALIWILWPHYSIANVVKKRSLYRRNAQTYKRNYPGFLYPMFIFFLKLLAFKGVHLSECWAGNVFGKSEKSVGSLLGIRSLLQNARVDIKQDTILIMQIWGDCFFRVEILLLQSKQEACSRKNQIGVFGLWKSSRAQHHVMSCGFHPIQATWSAGLVSLAGVTYAVMELPNGPPLTNIQSWAGGNHRNHNLHGIHTSLLAESHTGTSFGFCVFTFNFL